MSVKGDDDPYLGVLVSHNFPDVIGVLFTVYSVLTGSSREKKNHNGEELSLDGLSCLTEPSQLVKSSREDASDDFLSGICSTASHHHQTYGTQL